MKPTDDPDCPYPALLASDLQRAGGQPTRWLWHGYLALGEITLLTSLWKSGKTTLISILLARLKQGGMLGGFALAPGRAVVVTEEGPSIWYERSQVLPFDDHVCWICRPFVGKPRPEDWLALLDQIARFDDRQKIDLVVIDSLANLAPLTTENDAAEMLRTLLPLQRLTGRGMAVLVSHHPRKGPVVAGQAARGSGALSGFADVIVEMQRVSQRNAKDRRRRLRGFSRHEQTPPSWILELVPEGTDYLALGESAELTFERGWPILQAVLENADGPMTRRDLRLSWPDSTLAPTSITLYRWLTRLVKERLVEVNGTGSRKDPYRYKLPGIEKKWHRDWIKAFNEKLARMPEPPVRETTYDYRREPSS
jgi:hypothetical protein